MDDLGMNLFKHLHAGKITPADLFTNVYINEIYESENVLTTKKWLHVILYVADLHEVLGDFGAKHAKGKPTKETGNHPLPRKKINMQQENNAIVNSVVDEILLN